MVNANRLKKADVIRLSVIYLLIIIKFEVKLKMAMRTQDKIVVGFVWWLIFF